MTAKITLAILSVILFGCEPPKTLNEEIVAETKYCRENGMGITVNYEYGRIGSVTCNPENKP